ncbi:MAG TPA: transporter substrate-binding domain-containing protein [candidate division Zixibacteria bacterium]|nr:transporter substrate-binding domain-containing protein [candidate division Zixibacteria bacterium]
MRTWRRFAVLPIAALLLAACQAEAENIESLDDLAGKTVCAGESTTYVFWIQGTLTLPEGSGEIAEVPEGMQVTTLPTDIDCAEAWRSGRTDEFQGWLTALPTAQGAIDEGYPVKLVGDPVFYEPLAVAFDKSVENNDSLVEAVDAIISQMHADGTLSELSETWYDGTDLTRQEGVEPPEPEEGPTCDSGDVDGHLADICEAGTIVVSTDPAYPPQSFLNEETGEYEGFDIDVAKEIAERLGVDIEFTDPTFDAVVAGNWGGRWDMSVGSVTVTAERQEVLDFTRPYYFTPAQMAAYDPEAAAD